MAETSAEDPFRRMNYRRLIAWERRIRREEPFLLDLLDRAPDRSVVDLGCGTGEHAAHLAGLGARVLGVDRSEEQIQAARDHEREGGARFLCCEIAELPRRTDERFGVAMALGNVLPYLEDDELEAALAAVREALLPSGLLAAQVVNYERIRRRSIRHLPVNVRPDPDHPGAEIVFLRLLKIADEKHIDFFPTTCHLVPGRDPPVTVERSREVRLRAWVRADLEPLLNAAGFGEIEWYGDVERGAFDPDDSHDLVFVARRLPDR